jgi:hypothetical protein
VAKRNNRKTRPYIDFYSERAVSDAVNLPTKHELKLLTLRAIVAYAVRASQRVEPLYHSDNPAHEEAVKAANQIALEFVGTSGADDDDAQADAKVGAEAGDDTYAADRAAYAAADAAGRADVGSAAADAAARAAYAADRAADAAAYARFADADRAAAATARAADAAAAAAEAALRAATTSRADAIAACRRDYEKLLELSCDAAGELGQLFDVQSENGPLGPLWMKGEPAAFMNAGK